LNQNLTRSPSVARKADRTVYDVRTLSGIAVGSLVFMAIPDVQFLAVWWFRI